MTLRNTLAGFACMIAMSFAFLPAAAQTGRGKAELDAAGGKIAVDYGRPQLKGRDPLTWQQNGTYWRMGSNSMTTLTTPVDLAFGNTKLPKGTYGLWLLKVAADRYELVFNSETSGMGMSHDKAKDLASVPMKHNAGGALVESLTLKLEGAPGGGVFSLAWGNLLLSTDFKFGN